MLMVYCFCFAPFVVWLISVAFGWVSVCCFHGFSFVSHFRPHLAICFCFVVAAVPIPIISIVWCCCCFVCCWPVEVWFRFGHCRLIHFANSFVSWLGTLCSQAPLCCCYPLICVPAWCSYFWNAVLLHLRSLALALLLLDCCYFKASRYCRGLLSLPHCLVDCICVLVVSCGFVGFRLRQLFG